MSSSSANSPFNVNSTHQSEHSNKSRQMQISGKNYALQVLTSSLNILTYLVIGIIVGILLLFTLSAESLGATQLHIILCVIGYQLLMTMAILSQSPNNGWSIFLTLRDKRRTHAVLQIIGSGLAIAGSFVKITNKQEHWNTIHGQFALVALVFTTMSLVSGLTSLYAFEWRRFIPGTLSKLTHICFGIVAFTTACITLCFGFHKNFFRTWANDAFANTLIVLTCIFAVSVILNPIVTFFYKSLNIIKK